MKTRDTFMVFAPDPFMGERRARVRIEKHTWKVWRGENHALIATEEREFTIEQVVNALWPQEAEGTAP